MLPRRKESALSQSDTRDEAVYDAYLSACASGRAEPPDVVLQRNPGVSDVVRARMHELWRASGGLAPAAAVERLAHVGPYRLVERLDAGGMGTVYRARRDDDGAEVAVKVLRPELAGSGSATERLRREAMALARLRHPSVVRVHGFGEDAGTAYLVLELVQGRGLEEILADAATRGELLAVERVARWGAALARGLQAAHDQGVIHRDVKPSNVRVRPDDAPALLDFGIARVPERTPGALTTTFAGSPFYAAPEQLTGAAVDGRADVYGLCATLYQCLTGSVPFAGDRFETILRRVLVETPVPLRRLAPHVPRDLETVVLAGLEKDPSRRPPTARALAEDLEAAILGRPVRSRRAGPLRSAARWARARPGAAASVSVVAVALLAAAGAVVFAREAARERVLDEARSALREASERTDRYARGTADAEALAYHVVRSEADAQQGWLPDEDLARLESDAERLTRLRRDRDTEFHGVLALLERCERLAPRLPGVSACRARLFFQRWREASVSGDAAAADFYRRMVATADPGGPMEREVSASATLSILPDPPDSEVHLFRSTLRSEVAPGGGARLVPVPLRGAAPGADGAPWALRVVEPREGVPEGAYVLRLAGHAIEDLVLARRADAPLLASDRLASIGGAAVRDVAEARRLGGPGPVRRFVFLRGAERIERDAPSLDALGYVPATPAEAASAGGLRASLWIDGAIVERDLPEGLVVRTTAAPVLAGASSRLGADEAASITLPPAEYIVLLRAPGRCATRVVAHLASPGASALVACRLPLAGERVPGCVPVAPEAGSAGALVWFQEREVTVAEYAEFLADPEVGAEIAASAAPILVPRHEVDPTAWRLGTHGRWSPPAGTTPDHPVLGVSFEDACRYAAWRSARARAEGAPWRWRMPTYREWLLASGVTSGRAYPFGPAFRPRWASSCFARPQPAPEPVLSYPVDESPLGVFDLAGSAMEWVDDWYDRPRGLRRLAGGSWAQGDAAALRGYAPRGARPDRADREFGIRLVAERIEGRR